MDPESASQAFLNIAESEYDISYFANIEQYKAPNRAHSLRFTIDATGFAVEPRTYDTESPPWKCHLAVVGFGKDSRFEIAPQSGTLHVDGRNALVQTEDIVVDYHNSPAGLKQNFLLPRRPPGEQMLAIRLQVSTDSLSLSDNPTGEYISLRLAEQEVARYTELKVWDAKGERLAAEMRVVPPNLIVILVNDVEAAYPILVDPLTVGVGLNPSQTGAQFGFAVSTLGDVQFGVAAGLVVGAPYFDTGLQDAGRVFIYDNSGGWSYTPTYTISGTSANERFGYSVAMAGDFDSNGYDDVIVGSPYFSGSGKSQNGRVTIYGGSGSGLVTNTPLWWKEGGASGMNFGFSVAGEADVNGDTAPDIIVGAPYANYGSYSYIGRAQVFHGSTSGTPDANADWDVYCPQTASYQFFGWSVANLGAVKLNGYDAIAIGAPGYTNQSAA